jgi:hypothetical protein
MGFSTGEWQGRVLKVRTTHIKQGWHRRNGIPMSEKTVMTEFFYRHDNVLTQVSITEDPIFLEEPLVKTTNLTLDVATTPNQYQAIPRMCRTTCRVKTRISPSSRQNTDCPYRRRVAALKRCIRSTWTRSKPCRSQRRRRVDEGPDDRAEGISDRETTHRCGRCRDRCALGERDRQRARQCATAASA